MLEKTMIGACVVAVSLSLTACGGSDTTVQTTASQGQQLIDLKEAYDKGVISIKEYEKTKAKILKGG